MRSDTKTRSARPRGRPRAYDADAALGAARDAFWAAGYSATSLADLATATGMNRPSLYAAFGNKQALYLKALAQLGGNMEQQVGAVLGAPLPLAEALRRFYLNALTLYHRPYSAGTGRSGHSVSLRALLRLAILTSDLASWVRQAPESRV